MQSATPGEHAGKIRQRSPSAGSIVEKTLDSSPNRSGSSLWKAVRQFVLENFGISLSRSSCLNYPVSSTGQALRRLGFAFKRPKKRLLKADAAKRAIFVAEYAAMWEESRSPGTRIFFADEAHFRADVFRADVELRGKWVQKGEPALVDSTSPSYGEKASCYSNAHPTLA